MTQTSVLRSFEHSVDHRSADLALVDLAECGGSLSWSEVGSLVEQAAESLGALATGDRIVLQMPNSARLVAYLLAAAKLGVVSLPLHASTTSEALDRVVKSYSARMVVDSARTRPISQSARARFARDEDETVHIQLTSGTTGAEKGVPHAASHFDVSVDAVARRVRLTGDDIVHIAAPIAHHSGYVYGFWLGMTFGCVQVLQPRWNAGVALEAMANHGSTVMQGTPTHLYDLTRAVISGKRAPQSLRTFVVTGAPVPQGLAIQAQDVLKCDVLAAWGSSELCMATLVSPSDDLRSRATDGFPLPGVRLRVVDADGVPRGPDEVGELQARTLTMARGYIGAEDLRPFPLVNGWYPTGDIALLTKEGALRILGRASDVVNRGGIKVPAAMVESALRREDRIVDVAVVGRSDIRLGERAVACVVVEPHQTVTLDELKAHLATAGIPRIYWPESLEIFRDFPRNASGKVDRARLRQRVAHPSSQKDG